jgi:peptide/nickel transport system permease protein
MGIYIVRRLLAMIPTMFGITVITFLIIQLAPGNPAEMKIRMARGGEANPQFTAQVIEQTKKLYGLDKPIHVRYGIWLKQVVTFNFGDSYKDHRPVRDKILERAPVSLQISFISLLLVYLIAVPLGVFSAVKQDSFADRALTLVLFVLYSLPSFWTAMMLITFLGGGEFLDWFPIYGLSSEGAQRLALWPWLGDRVHHLVLPVFCLTYESLAYVSRQMRGSMLEVIRQDYIRTARAKGLAEKTVVLKHALRNSLIPIVTMLAVLLPALIGGSVIVESIFSVPGMGQLSFEAILSRDYPVIMGVTTMAAILTLIGILVADVAYTLVDPRITFATAPLTFSPRRFLTVFAAIAAIVAAALVAPSLGLSPGRLVIEQGPRIAAVILFLSVAYGVYLFAGERAYWRSILRQFNRHRLNQAALLGILFLLATAVFSPLIANDKPIVISYQGRMLLPALRDYLPGPAHRYPGLPGSPDWSELAAAPEAGFSVWPAVTWGPYQIDQGHFLEAPSASHLLGTDEVGRDILARIVYGARIALSVGFVAVGIYIWIGIILGSLAGYYGGWVDMLISRLIEVMISIPTFFLIIAAVAFLEPSIYNVMAAIAFVGWTGTARLVRGEFLRLRNKEFVEATRALGARDLGIIFRHVLPNALTPVLVVATFGVADAILIESALSFLGFGVMPPTPSWGDILSKSRSYYEFAWWLTVFPGLAIFFTVTALNLVGEGVRDAIDPRLKDVRR